MSAGQVPASEMLPHLSLTRMYGPASVVVTVPLPLQVYTPASLPCCAPTSANGIGKPGCSVPSGPIPSLDSGNTPPFTRP